MAPSIAISSIDPSAIISSTTPELRAFADRFRERYDREPGPYAIVGYRAMRGVLAAIARAGDRAGYRQEVLDASCAGARRPGPITARRADGRYLDLD